MHFTSVEVFLKKKKKNGKEIKQLSTTFRACSHDRYHIPILAYCLHLDKEKSIFGSLEMQKLNLVCCNTCLSLRLFFPPLFLAEKQYS